MSCNNCIPTKSECPNGYIKTACVYYDGANLLNTPILKNENLTTILTKLDAKIGTLTAATTGGNRKEKINFDDEAYIDVDWTLTRRNNFSEHPIIQTWMFIEDDTKAQPISVDMEAIFNPTLQKIRVFLPGRPGYIIIS